MPGVVHFSALKEDSNVIFKALPPRKNYYRIVFGSTTLSTEVLVDILNLKDPDYPMNISTDGDAQDIEKAMS